MAELSHVLLADVARAAGCPLWFASRAFDAGLLTAGGARLLRLRLVPRAERGAVVKRLRELMLERGVAGVQSAGAA